MFVLYGIFKEQHEINEGHHRENEGRDIHTLFMMLSSERKILKSY